MNNQKKPNKPLSKYIRWSIALITIIVVGFFVFNNSEQTNNKTSFITAIVKRDNIEDSVMASGRVKAIKSVDVGAQVSGEITKLYVKVGDIVKKGDPIAQIDKINQNNQLNKTRATLTQSVANLDTAKATLYNQKLSMQAAQSHLKKAQSTLELKESELINAERYLKRIKPLLEISAVSKTTLDDAKQTVITKKNAVISAESDLQGALANIEIKKTDIVSAEAQIASQEANVEKSNMDVNTANTNVRNTKIVAPMSGTVVKVLAEQGATVNANHAAPTIVTLADLSRIRIDAQISETDVGKVKVGTHVNFYMIGSPEEKHSEVISGIEPAPEPTNQHSAVYYVGYVEAFNPNNKFLIDMTAQLEIIIKEAKDVLVIPSSAIKKNEQGNSFVRVLDNSSTENKSKSINNKKDEDNINNVVIKVGIDNRVHAQVLSGLAEGDEVIISSIDGSIKKNKYK